MSANSKYRFLFAGGGTAGHLFPAVAVAQQILLLKPEADIMFIGTKSKIEGKVIPQLGYKFKSVWIKGFSRKFNFENLLFPLKLIVSFIQSLLINMKFKPKVAVGSGGYVSGPAILAASTMGAKIILLEQNSYPGITTRLLEKYADEIHVSYEESKKYFRQPEKLFVTGNPIKVNLKKINKQLALSKFNLKNDKKTLLVTGGSLGAGSINKVVAASLSKLHEKGIQVIWQTGNTYYDSYKNLNDEGTYVNPFIDDMSAAYSACDLLLARSGATTIAEITSLGIPAILVPSPNVAENHQYFNAKSLEDKKSAVLIKDSEIEEKFISSVTGLIFNQDLLFELQENSKKLGRPEAADSIAKRAIALLEGNLS
jgi:UDP-N-acetylglucosamine--N-acetylmuramyl-(pentapeptide) pyrophosphoryl-undecaprenol N-acetylglucosamine transferase